MVVTLLLLEGAENIVTKHTQKQTLDRAHFENILVGSTVRAAWNSLKSVNRFSTCVVHCNSFEFEMPSVAITACCVGPDTDISKYPEPAVIIVKHLTRQKRQV